MNKGIERKFSAIINVAPVCIHEIDLNGRLTSMNPAGLRMMGCQSQSEILGLNYLDVPTEDDKAKVKELLDLAIQGQGSEFEFRVDGEDGFSFFASSFQPLRDEDSKVIGIMGVTSDITPMRRYQDELERLAHYDDLTNLPNKRLILSELHEFLGQVQQSDLEGALLFVDLDDFKKINDTLGHKTGDQLLKEAGARLQSLECSQNIVGRFGGDEFVIILPKIKSDTDLAVECEKILKAFEVPFEINGTQLSTTVSIGASRFPEQGTTAGELLRKSDIALSQAKQSGRNRFTQFENELNAKLERAVLIENQLRHALKNGEISLALQPIVSVTDQSICGGEALMRWNNPILGFVGPDEFIPIAEHTGLILSLGEFVLELATDFIRDIEPMSSADFSIAVNLSPIQFQDPDLVSKVERILFKKTLPPRG